MMKSAPVDAGYTFRSVDEAIAAPPSAHPWPAETAAAAVQTAVEIFRRLTKGYPSPDFAVRFWDGSLWQPVPAREPLFTVVVRHAGAMRRMFHGQSQVELGEAYAAGDFSVEGDLESSFRLADYVIAKRLSFAERLRIGRMLRTLPASHPGAATRRPRERPAARVTGVRHSAFRDRQAVAYHYDTSNEFFALWLDPLMVYSSAYFLREDESLERAQQRKLDYVCRKLRLAPGERLLDIGCGWGALVQHAARRFGADALGITLSQPQAGLARTRIDHAHLNHLCRVELRDYRELEERDAFDKIASVGMIEHVGVSRLGDFFGVAWRLLRPGGALLLHGIAESPISQRRPGPFFADHYVFPDSELPRLSELLEAAEDSGFEVRDVESLREHYVLTLREWRRRLERNRLTAIRSTSEATYELWRLFLAGGAYRFRTGDFNVYQTLLVKPDKGASRLPLTRADWYT